MDQYSPFWARLKESMSIESQKVQKCRKDYITAKLIDNPTYLIVDTNFTNHVGEIVSSKIKEEVDLKK